MAVVKSSGTLSLSYVGVFPFSSLMAYVNCSGSSKSNYTYTLNKTINLNLPACVGDLDTTTGTLTSIIKPIPPVGFANLAKNTDGSWNISIFSTDVEMIDLTFTYFLEFYDSSGALVDQPTWPYLTITIIDPCLIATDFIEVFFYVMKFIVFTLLLIFFIFKYC